MVLKVDEQFPTHTKVLGLSHRAFRLHVTALCYCAANLTDGLVVKEALPIIGAVSGRGKVLTDELEQARLWVKIPVGWTIHGFLEWNQSKEDAQERRRIGKESADRRWRARGNTNGNGSPIGSPTANGTGGGNAKPNASPAFAQPLEALASSPPFTNHDDRESEGGHGHDAHASKIDQLIKTCRTTGEDRQKILRAARGCAEGDLVAALEACTGPGVKDRLAVALSELKKRRDNPTPPPPERQTPTPPCASCGIGGGKHTDDCEDATIEVQL